MYIIYKKKKELTKVKNWDTALHICAEEYKKGTPKNQLKIIDHKGREHPVKIQHLIFFKN